MMLAISALTAAWCICSARWALEAHRIGASSARTWLWASALMGFDAVMFGYLAVQQG